jgi:hypothetical protein
VFEDAIRILAEPTIGRSTRRLNVCHVPVARTKDSQKRLGMHCARTNLGIEWLLDGAASRGPEFGQLEDQTLKRHRVFRAQS